jgi:hypothetical protein
MEVLGLIVLPVILLAACYLRSAQLHLLIGKKAE